MSPNDVTEVSNATTSTLIPGVTIPLHFPKGPRFIYLLEAVLMFIMIQNHLKSVYLKINLLVKHLINFIFKTLQHYHFLNSMKSIGIYQSKILLLIILTNFKIPKLLKIKQVDQMIKHLC